MSFRSHILKDEAHLWHGGHISGFPWCSGQSLFPLMILILGVATRYLVTKVKSSNLLPLLMAVSEGSFVSGDLQA